MARYPSAHKEVTRQRILEKAGRRFKEDGIDGSGISTLMSDAGLTSGAFYAHFESKNDLVASVVAEELRTQEARYDTMLGSSTSLEDLVREYLSPEHRDHPGSGCPSAALLDEIGRCGDATRQAYTDGAMRVVDKIAAYLIPQNPKSARGLAIGLFTTMVGTLQLSRAISDQELAEEILNIGIDNALALARR
ncbi:TetR/AcrR family transcriptional regulator [Streptomyces chartreusis]|uniref:TetR/AcrR family transcriptional regulator n=1 Tax=Streptomyces chartreusis TaxID=1969 RepID=UPI0033F4E56E